MNMRLFVQHQGQQTGPFSIEEIRAGLDAGTYQPTDLGWREGLPDWKPLSTLLSEMPSLPPTIPAQPETSKLAIWSLVLGLVGFVLVGLTAIPAVICGHLAISEIKKSNGRLTGGGMAIAGLICGYLMSVILAIAMLAGLTAPMVIRQKKKADQMEAMNNARQIGIAMMQFEADYGSFPSDATADKVANDSETELETGTSSNAYFRQLIRAGVVSTEQMFYAKSSGSRKPDDQIEGNLALESGECGFAYVSNLEPNSEASRPLALTPLKPGTMNFDDLPYDDKVIILWTDGSVTNQSISKYKNLLDPTHPVWAGKPPEIALPE